MKLTESGPRDIFFSEFQLNLLLRYLLAQGPSPTTCAQIIKNQVGKISVSRIKCDCICAHWCHRKGVGNGKLSPFTLMWMWGPRRAWLAPEQTDYRWRITELKKWVSKRPQVLVFCSFVCSLMGAKEDTPTWEEWGALNSICLFWFRYLEKKSSE